MVKKLSGCQSVRDNDGYDWKCVGSAGVFEGLDWIIGQSGSMTTSMVSNVMMARGVRGAKWGRDNCNAGLSIVRRSRS